MFWCKTHFGEGNLIVAICDQKLLCKKIGKNPRITVEKRFYGKELIDDEKAVGLMKKANICNILGKEIINIALEKKFITKENIILIGDIPHAQFIQ
jgi:hypothetical protein